jgi:hypothetical protein
MNDKTINNYFKKIILEIKLNSDDEEVYGFKPGMKVTYKPKEEKGILKSFLDGPSEAAYVIYNCNNDWENCEDYTISSTVLTDLKQGW